MHFCARIRKIGKNSAAFIHFDRAKEWTNEKTRREKLNENLFQHQNDLITGARTNRTKHIAEQTERRERNDCRSGREYGFGYSLHVLLWTMVNADQIIIN